MRVLVAGGGGFLGSRIAEVAGAAGFDVSATWRSVRPPADIDAHRVDFADHDELERIASVVRPDVVVIALGGPHRPSTPAERAAVWSDAPVATTALLDAVREIAPHVVLLASAHEFSRSDESHGDTDGIRPVSLRGVASRAAVDTARLWSDETGAGVTVLRPFSVYGPGEPRDRVIPTLIRAALNGRPFSTTALDSGRDFVHVDDIAAAVVEACRARPVGEFNLGTGVNTSVLELVRIVEDVTGRRIDLRHGDFAPRPWDRPRWVGDSSSAQRALGWHATIDLAEGIGSYPS